MTMPLSIEEDEIHVEFICPHLNCSVVCSDALTFDLHLRYCRKKSGCELTVCKSNSTHIVPKHELACHSKICCSHKQEVDDFIRQIRESAMQFIHHVDQHVLTDRWHKIDEVGDQIVHSTQKLGISDRNLVS